MALVLQCLSSSVKYLGCDMRLILAAAVVLMGASCVPRGSNSHQEISKPHFIPFSSASQCGFTYGYYPELKVCFDSAGASNAAVERQKKYFTIGIGKWMDALRQIDPRLTNRVALSCNNPHFNVTVNPGSGIATSGCGQANVFSSESSGDESGEDPVLQGTTLHELGHGLAGLNDTYSGRQAGACQDGQPESIMCWGGYGSKKDAQGYKTLYDDDIQGIQSQFQKFQSFMNIPPGGIPPAGTNAGGQGQGSGGSIFPPVSADLFAAIGNTAPNSVSQLLALSTSATNVRMTLCDQNSLSACQDPFVTPAAAFEFKKTIGNRNVYARAGIVPVASKTYTILVWRAQGQPVAMRSIQFRAK